MAKQNGQTISEMQRILRQLSPEGLTLAKYEMIAYTPDGKKLIIKYDVKDDERFKSPPP